MMNHELLTHDSMSMLDGHQIHGFPVDDPNTLDFVFEMFGYSDDISVVGQCSQSELLDGLSCGHLDSRLVVGIDVDVGLIVQSIDSLLGTHVNGLDEFGLDVTGIGEGVEVTLTGFRHQPDVLTHKSRSDVLEFILGCPITLQPTPLRIGVTPTVQSVQLGSRQTVEIATEADQPMDMDWASDDSDVVLGWFISTRVVLLSSHLEYVTIADDHVDAVIETADIQHRVVGDIQNGDEFGSGGHPSDGQSLTRSTVAGLRVGLTGVSSMLGRRVTT